MLVAKYIFILFFGLQSNTIIIYFVAQILPALFMGALPGWLLYSFDIVVLSTFFKYLPALQDVQP